MCCLGYYGNEERKNIMPVCKIAYVVDIVNTDPILAIHVALQYAIVVARVSAIIVVVEVVLEVISQHYGGDIDLITY